MKEFYNSDEMFEQAQAISNSDDYKSLINNQITVTRQACRNILSRLCMNKPYECTIYMDENIAQGLEDSFRVICTSIYEKEGILIFVTNEIEYEFDNLDTDILVSIVNQL